MKKLLLSLCTAALAFAASAAEYTIEFATAENNNATTMPATLSEVFTAGAEYVTSASDVTNCSLGMYGLKVGQNKNDGAITLNLAADAIVTPTSISIQVSANKNPQNLGFYFNGTEYALESTAKNEAYQTVEITDFTGEIDAITFALKHTNASTASNQGFLFIKSVTVEYDEGDTPVITIPAPTFELVEGTEGFTVKMACEDAAAKIYYTVDESTPAVGEEGTTEYTAPVEVWQPTTFKAIAVKGEETSKVATFAANVPIILYNIGDLNSIDQDMVGAAGIPIELRGTATGIYQNGAYTYITSAFSYALIYGNDQPEVKNGDTIENLKGTYVIYNGLPEIKDATYTVTAGTAADAIAPMETEIEYIAANQVNFYVLLKSVEISGLSGKNGTITGASADGEPVELALYNRFNITLEEGKGFDVTGFVSVYNGTVQLQPTEITEGVVMEQVATPVIDPDGGELEAGATITITCETVGATIYYTTDGTEPTDESTEYTAPIAFAEAMTVKAIAVAEGMLDSDVVSASFTLHDPNAPQDFTAEFDFTDLASLTPAVDPADKDENNAINIEDKTFTSGKVSVRVTTEEGSKTSARFYESSGVWSLRGYAGTTITVSVPTGYALVTVEMTGSLSKIDNLTGGVWTATGSETSVEFTPTASTTIKTMTVNYKGTSGIADAAVDANAPVEYFNLQGVRVANPEGGLYIRRQGANVSKVIIR